jgi:uncharacterized protein YjbI with pentapeptide repeats
MADEEHVALLRQGVEVWNTWRKKNPDIIEPDLGRVNLSGAILKGADLRSADLIGINLHQAFLRNALLSQTNLREATLARADLIGADLNEATLAGADLVGAHLHAADLSQANLRGVTLVGADLSGARLVEAVLSRADLSRADLDGADLSGADLREANLYEANLRGATFFKTGFGNTNLTKVKGLDICQHRGPSFIDHQTLQKSGFLPLTFLRGVGLPERLIDYLPSLLNQPIQFYSCFISYSSEDQEFADRLHADLQNKGVRCWFAPHDMAIGAKIIDAIDEAIRLRDKVLLILSEHSVASDWVEEEVTRALDEERSRKTIVLFPIRVDDAVLNTDEAWARGLRIQRNIGDFCRWKNHDAYQKVLERVLRDLKMAQAGP